MTERIDTPDLAGFRLHCLELYNWGTFHNDVWHIDPGGRNSLLTGDIGSGKSTLVDAVTTLLVPHHRIVFNKAAGAGTKERSLYSYIRGEYKNVKYDYEQTGKPVALRDENACTILLGYFYNQAFDTGITLAQVFWLKDNRTQPERFFVIAESQLSITDHFTDFGDNILDLKKRLKKQPRVQVLDQFKSYSSKFRRLFGIKDPQALDLFHQTVSMKSVGNLTEFIRMHMLERTDVATRIQDIRKNFDNLNKAYEAVIQAKEQVAALTPICEYGKTHAREEDQQKHLHACRNALNPYFAYMQIKLLTRKIEQLQRDSNKLQHNLQVMDNTLSGLRQKHHTLQKDIDDNGGRRIQDIAKEVRFLERERDQKKQREHDYLGVIEVLGLVAVHRVEAFWDNRKQAEKILKQEDRRLKEIQDQQVTTRIAMNNLQEKIKAIDEEIVSLKSRKSNIPLRNLALREKMARVLGVDEETMPFVGELIRVDEDESLWEGALERLLHNWGLSLLVPEQRYDHVSQYVDKTHLAGRLVYFRVPDVSKPMARGSEAHENSLVHKIRIKPDTPHYGWLFNELVKRFDYACCDTLAGFKQFPRAITRKGQMKTGGQRHEKDDRYSIHDRSRYILGWQNKEKIKTLEGIKTTYQREGASLFERLKTLVVQQERAILLTDNCRQLLKFTRYEDILWQETATKIQALDQEKKKIEESSDILKTLKKQLKAVETDIELQEKEKAVQARSLGRVQQQHADRKREFLDAKKEVKQIDSKEMESLFNALKGFTAQALLEKSVNLNNFALCRTTVREYIQNKIGTIHKRLTTLNNNIIREMQNFKNRYPQKSSEVDAAIESLAEFDEMLAQLITQDLPRHEEKFKTLLNTGTINSIALFQNQLDKKRREIEKKINLINTSLNKVEYSPGTFIKLIISSTQDSEVRDFQTDLKQCLSHTLDGEDIYNEKKFLEVKMILDRFNGRQAHADLDRRWTDKVTDVRNWFVFSAVEIWKETGEDREYYSDSSGKSGGQKEKLAYTILASALAYQFGLEWGEKKSRTFRFVVIDEAFGRGSDESTRYGLELFKKLNLQLLIVTPLQKINIIEDYINAVHFVHNEGGKRSVLKNLTVDEYREEKQTFLERQSV